MQSIIKKTTQKVAFYLLGFALSGCSSANNEMAGGNLQAINHTMHGINWMSVNGYRADGGGGSSCCIIMPVKWRPGLKAQIEWEVDPETSSELLWLNIKPTISATTPPWTFQSGLGRNDVA
jgi:hypothetical protein